MNRFRWLGASGVELTLGNQTMLFDPFFTRPPLWKFLWSHPQPDKSLIVGKIQSCQNILVTHPHYDHLLDVPELAFQSNAVVYGSANACQLLSLLGVPSTQIQQINAGDRFTFGDVEVEVFSADHDKLPIIDHWIDGPLPSNLRPPLRLPDYRMDTCFGFLLQVDGMRILFGKSPVKAEVLFVAPLETRAYFKSLLNQVQPRLVIPIHWDNFFQPLSKLIHPLVPAWLMPIFGRMSLSGFKTFVEGTLPQTKLILPDIFRSYSINDLL